MKLVSLVSKLTIFGGVNCQVQIVDGLDLDGTSADENELGRTERRYQQLITQMNFYNKEFDPRLVRALRARFLFWTGKYHNG